MQADSLPAEPQGKPKYTGVGSLSLLQRIFPTQKLNRGLLHCRWILDQLSYEGRPTDLKDAFYSILLGEESQFLFAFEDPTQQASPQGFCDNPHLFGQSLSQDLQNFNSSERVVLQYVNNIPLCTETEEAFSQALEDFLNFLAGCGCKASREKAHFCQQSVKYLGLIISEGTRAISPEKIEPVLNHPLPVTLRQLRGFWGITGYCRIWIPYYGELAWPLYKLITETQQGQTEKLVWC